MVGEYYPNLIFAYISTHHLVDVLDLASSSVQKDQQQLVSHKCSLCKVFAHINSDTGQVLNGLDLPDSTGLFAPPGAVMYVLIIASGILELTSKQQQTGF